MSHALPKIHVIAANEGPGNTVNPLMSLVDKEVCSIPMLLLIVSRGDPESKDEPQHIKQAARIRSRRIYPWSSGVIGPQKVSPCWKFG
jgi:hypothetical protein